MMFNNVMAIDCNIIFQFLRFEYFLSYGQMYGSKLLNLTPFSTLELTIRGLTGYGSPRIHKVPICLS